MPNPTPVELTGQQTADLAHALGAFAVLISTVATLPDHPSIGPVKEMAEKCRLRYELACDTLGITEQNYVAITRKEGTE